MNLFETIKDLHLFARRLTLRCLYDKKSTEPFPIEQFRDCRVGDFRALRKLLLEDTDADEISNMDESVFSTYNDSTLNEDVSCLTVDTAAVQEFDPGLRARSQKFPTLQSNPGVWAFVSATTKAIKELKINENNKFSGRQRAALQKLQSNGKIVIKPSDKGGNIVILDNSQYEKMCMDILQNRHWYSIIQRSFIDEAKAQYETLVAVARNDDIIDKNTFEFLNVGTFRVATFYVLPKIHKNRYNPPGRPIVSGCGCLTENASKLIDKYLKPHVEALSSYVKDTIHMLKIIEDITIPPNSWLVTIDVESLYSSIPHDKGLDIISNFLSERDSFSSRFNGFVLQLLEFILTHNFFIFNGQYYLQRLGVAMGTSCAPSFANLYLGGWERQLFSNDELTDYLSNILTYHRYIDDIFLVWTGTLTSLNNFITVLNSNNYNLFFTMQCHQTKISFLDIFIIANPDGSLASSLYWKETAGNTILHANSSHPQHVIKSIPYAQYLRIRRNCSNYSDFLKEAKDLQKRLLQRGYSRSSLKKAFNRASCKNRHDLIFAPKFPTVSDTTKFVTNYSLQHESIRSILNRYWPLLTADSVAKKFVKSSPEMAFKRPNTIRNQIVHSHYESHFGDDLCKGLIKGTFKCEHCKWCKWVLDYPLGKLPNGDKFYPKHHVTCRTQGVIYLMLCTCNAFYVGKTKRAFCERIREHVYACTNGLFTSNVSRHFIFNHNYDFTGMRFVALDCIHPSIRGGDWDKEILKRESRWIFKLNAIRPPGLNDQLSFKPYLPS